jgi:hypothetical protein
MRRGYPVLNLPRAFDGLVKRPSGHARPRMTTTLHRLPTTTVHKWPTTMVHSLPMTTMPC